MDIHVLLSLFHILLVVPFFLWVGVSRGTLPEGAFTACFIIGLFLVVYHAVKAWIRFQKQSSYLWVNLIHALWIGPLLMYIGARKKDAPRPAYELLLLTGFAALGYHLYELATHYDFL
jgi:hypothetical protein